MADLKISQLNAGDPAQTNDEIPIARSGANFKITAGSISALPPTTAGANQVIYVDSAGTSLDGDSTFVYTAATGRLGIGTASPSYSLQVENSLATQLYLRGAGAGYTQTSILLASSTATLPETRGLGTYMFNEGTDNTFYMGTFYNGSNTWGIGLAAGATFQTSAADVTNSKFVVTSTGNVGVGTTSPSYRLTTNYTAPATFTNAVGDFNQMWQASGTNALGVALSTGDTTARFVVNNGYAFAWNNAASEFMRLTSAGNLGVGTTSPVFKLVVSNAGAQGFEFDPSAGLMQVYNRSTSSYGEFRPYASLMRFFTGSSPTETMRLDSSGRLLVGGTTAFGSANGSIEVSNTSGDQIFATRFINGTGGPQIALQKSRGSLGVNTIVADNDTLGLLYFYGANGTGYTGAAYIQGAVDGTPGATNDMPGRLVFATTADGSGAPTERARIDSAGRLLLGTTTSIASWTSGRAMDLQIAATTSFPGLSTYAYSTSTQAAGILITGRSRGAFGVLSATSGGDALGYLAFEGVNTANTAVAGAYIKGAQDGAAGAVNIPGRIEFYVSTGSANPQERMRLDNAGNLGINTTNPVAKLQLGTAGSVGASAATNQLFGDYSTAAQLRVMFNNASNYVGLGTDASNNLILGTSTANAGTSPTALVTLTQSGNLGIGTTSPSGKLHVNGNFLRIDQSGANQVYFGNAGDLITGAPAGGAIRFDGTALRFASSSTQIAMFDASGNLGLGVTPPAWGSNHKAISSAAVSASHLTATVNALSIGVNYYSDNTNFIYVTTGQNATRYSHQPNGEHRWFIAPSGTAGNPISFTQAMTLDASGNLGIGTTSPGALLDVYSATTSNYVRVGSASTFSAGLSIAANANTHLTSGSLVYQDSSNRLNLLNYANAALRLGTNNTFRVSVPAAGGMVVGTAALATNATDGFLYVPTCAGAPTGTPTAQTGTAPIVIDTTNNKLYFYSGGAWRDAGP